ncbi:hypothetical protein [Candidatus Bodocaedibacter vickermanii]|uniref:Uncharacterized protein n=1 Tax=Candidatus Bodocaedibacter vickermanii TaxID=2741701 RepID=A0A7L9RU29_9PROT|nr:hypothetical protein CPBP_00873 [Candidatus Paracaedibacteraceae bacterium 'Lake Konstanz']
MRRFVNIACALFMVSVCQSVSGEAVSPGCEAYFQIALIANREVVALAPTSTPAPVLVPTADQKMLVGFQKIFSDFVNAHQQDKRGMVIGRGNVQGVADVRITIPELKGLSWLFVDPGDAGAVGYLHNNKQDTTQGNALATTWPVDFSTEGLFDAVVFDDGALQYIGNDGTEVRLGPEYFQKQMALVVTKEDGTQLSKNSFQYPYLFQDWLLANRPAEFLRLEAQYQPLISAARKKQRKILEKGLHDAYRALKRGGVLIVPVDGAVDGIDFVNLLSISSADLVRHRIEAMGANVTESPILPEIARGMGTAHGDYYSIVRK